MFDDQAKIIEQRLRDGWNNRTRIVWDNTRATVKRGRSWIRITMTWVDSQLLGEAERGPYRDYGLAVVEIYTPRNVGTQVNSMLCEEVQSIFKQFTQGGMFCAPSHVERGPIEQEWFHQNVYIPFHYDYSLT